MFFLLPTPSSLSLSFVFVHSVMLLPKAVFCNPSPVSTFSSHLSGQNTIKFVPSHGPLQQASGAQLGESFVIFFHSLILLNYAFPFDKYKKPLILLNVILTLKSRNAKLLSRLEDSSLARQVMSVFKRHSL